MTNKRMHYRSKNGKVRVETKQTLPRINNTGPETQISLLVRDNNLNSESYVIVSAFNNGQCRFTVVQVEDTCFEI